MTPRKKLLIGLAVLAGTPLLLTALAVSGFYLVFYAVPRASGSIISSGQPREFLLFVPSGLDRGRPVPLVISFHAAAMWPGSQRRISQWNRQATEHGFIVVYPSGRSLSGKGTGPRPKAWHSSPGGIMEDVQFVADLIDTLSARYSVDPQRIYANGLSNGGRMAFEVACRLPSRVAAVGTVAAAQDLPSSWCGDATPVPVIAFHGTADPLVPYGGSAPRWVSPKAFPDVRTWIADWAGRNRCDPDPVDSILDGDVIRRSYGRCREGADVVLYTIEGGGHTWPGGGWMPSLLVGRTSRSLDATGLMWSFFTAHPRDSSRTVE